METGKRFLRVSGTFVLFFMALGLAVAPVWSQTTVNANWIDSTGNWTNASNWSCNCVPNNSPANVFNVTIQTGPEGVPYSSTSLDNTSSLSSVTINALFLGGGSTFLQIANGESLNVSGDLSNTSGASQGISIGGNSALSVTGNTSNAGEITDLGVLKSGNFSNSGFLGIGQFGPTGSLLAVNKGGSYTQPAGFTDLLVGTLMAPSVDITGGTLFGMGTINGNVLNASVVSPGEGQDLDGVVFSYPYAPYTTMAINGNYSQNADGTLVIGILSATDFSILDLAGKATLDGTVDFDFLNGYIPGPNTDFAFLKAGSVVGDFSSLDFMGINCPSCTFNLSTLSLDTGSTPPTFRPPVPEPGTLILFGTALLGLAALLRKKQWLVVSGS